MLDKLSVGALLMGDTEFDQLILSTMPHFIAVNYQRLLEANTPQEQVECALHIYNLGLRALTIGLVSQYITRDRDQVSDPYLNELILQKFPHLTLDAWQQLLFTSLKVYEGNKSRLFVPELYDFYWDTSTSSRHTPRPDVERPFTRLSQIFMETHKASMQPQTEEDWKYLARETNILLHEYLAGMTFITKYDLIRILDKDEFTYSCALHKGITITVSHGHLPDDTDLHPGQFYLRKTQEDKEEFLLLHPFLIFWEEDTSEYGLVPSDTGVYDRFVYERLQYLLPLVGRTVIDEEHIIEFITRVFDTIEEVKFRRKKTRQLTWWQLCDLCKQISENRMATVRGKYDANLYLQREKTRQAFERFLRSKEKKCFVLTGKSGVGKSNFILAVGEELRRTYSNSLAVLMYDGGHIHTKSSVTTFISQDFDARLKLPDGQIENIWKHIDRIDGIQECQLLLYVDAINENPDAKELLRQLDELVQAPWEWMKIVISSRPETWQRIKRGIGLAEKLYYREEGTDILGVEMDEFSCSEKMEAFSREELPEAYARYQQKFRLQTDYQELRSDLRVMLRDPLSLWLVAKTYEGQKIPAQLDASTLIAQYIQTLLHTERLRQDDLRLLEKRLIPLMVKEDNYSNVIMPGDIDEVGNGLYEAIYSEQILSNEERMNQSFRNLVDADILTQREDGREQTITFKYERFYDYFVGKHLFAICQQHDDKAAFIGQMVAQLKEKLFLWGVLRQVFADLLGAKEYALIERLGRTEDDFQADLLISVLPEYYSGYQAALHPILLRWLEETSEESLSARITANVAIAGLIENILERILIHANEQIRFIVVQHIHELWKADPDLTSRILNILPKSIKLLQIRHTRSILNTLLNASLLLVLHDYSYTGATTETVQIVRSLWKPIIEKLLLVSQYDTVERGLKIVRRVIVSLGISMAINVMKNLERDTFVFNFKDIETFFPASECQKAILTRLTTHFDAAVNESSESVEELTAYIRELAFNGDNNYIIQYTALGALIVHGKIDTLRMLKAFSKLYENLTELYPPTQDPANPTASVWAALNPFMTLPYTDMSYETAKPILEIFNNYIRTRIFRYRNRFCFQSGSVVRLGSVDNALPGYYFNIPEVGRELLKEIAYFEIKHNDYEHLRAGIRTIAMSMGRFKMPEAGTEALYDFIQVILQTGYLDRFSEDERNEFWRNAADSLVEFASSYREYLLDLLERFDPGDLPEEFSVRIRNATRKSSIEFNTGEAVMWAFNNALQDQNPFLRDFLKWFIHMTSSANSIKDWAIEILTYLIDFLYPGESLFS